MSEEKTLWQCSPSQLLNFKSFLFYGFLTILFLVGVIYAGSIVNSVLDSNFMGRDTYANYLRIFFLIPFFISLLILLYKLLNIKMTVYELTTERLRYSHGILSKTTEELELYRVKDIGLKEPFLLRIFGLGTIHLVTSDKSHPEFTLIAIRGIKEKRDSIRDNVERLRKEKRVSEIDFE